MAVYLACPTPLPETSRSPLVLEAVAEQTALRLKRHLVFPCLYFVASHEGCGCGFILDHAEGTDEDCALREESLGALRELSGAGGEILVCFDGEEAEMPEHSRTLDDPGGLTVKWGDRALYSVPPGRR